jgi:glycerol-3-phosphate dehydrogenase (NAD(P)+)
MKISVIGDGGWGTTMAIHLAKMGHTVTIWGPFPAYLEEMAKKRVNRKFLPRIKFPKSIRFQPDINRAVQSSEYVFIAAPSHFLRSVIKKIHRKSLKLKHFIILTKGIDMKTSQLASEVIQDELGRVSTIALSGPCIAREIAAGIPTAVVIAGGSRVVRSRVRKLLSNRYFTVLESNDIVGVQLGGSLKNVIAIAAGILDGLGFGTNAKSVLLARGIAEIARLGRKMRARPVTFLGLSGLGDLATTSFSDLSRNHNLGKALGEGKALRQILKSTEMVVEGVDAAKAAHTLAKKYHVAMPITEATYSILYRGRDPQSIVKAVFHKHFTHETH